MYIQLPLGRLVKAFERTTKLQKFQRFNINLNTLKYILIYTLL